MTHAILTTVADRPGMLSSLTKVLADHDANITYVDIHSGAPRLGIYFEVSLPEGTAVDAVLADLGDKRRELAGATPGTLETFKL